MTGRGSAAFSGRNQRRRKLIDARLQGILLVALVVLEVGLLAGATLYLFHQFSVIIDQNLFVIHRSAQRPLLPAFLKEMGTVVMIMSVLNTLALLVAHKLWVRHIQVVTQDFRDRLERIRALDFRAHDDRAGPRHEVLERLEQWRQAEDRRYAELAGLLAQLPAPEGGYSDAERARIAELLERCRALLSAAR